MTGAQEKALDRLSKKHTISYSARGEKVEVTWTQLKYGTTRFVTATVTPDGQVVEKP